MAVTALQAPRAATRAERRAEQARRMRAEHRRRIVAAFFAAHPGGASGPLGLGRAVADFVEWEIASGRLADATGSAWWRTVNGLMMLDLRDAREGRARGAATAWRAYQQAPLADAQARLWDAHQRSLDAAVEAATGLRADEPPAERRFIDLVLSVVARAADARFPTDNADLAVLTARHYPARYPVTRVQLARLRAI